MLDNTPPIPIVSSIAPLSQDKCAWLVDIWGVMHNGVAPFATAVEACHRFRDSGGTIVLLSNAPRPHTSVAEALDRIGVPRTAWDAIVSSGDVSRGLIAKLGDTPVFHIGPERDLPLFDGLGTRLVAEKDARAIVCTGLWDDAIETPADYTAQLAGLAARKLPMICANPDIKVERGNKIIYCAGAIAAAYEEIGGAVEYAGKPYLPVYVATFELLGKLRGKAVSTAEALAIGDGLNTDIKGAHAAGVDSVYIASAVNMASGTSLDSATLTELFSGRPERPLAAMTNLAW